MWITAFTYSTYLYYKQKHQNPFPEKMAQTYWHIITSLSHDICPLMHWSPLEAALLVKFLIHTNKYKHTHTAVEINAFYTGWKYLQTQQNFSGTSKLYSIS